MTCGVYEIRNILNGKMYVGSSKNVERRFVIHLSQLRNCKHHNKHLQRAFLKYGENSFEMVIIESCDSYELFERESFWIENKHAMDELCGYNIGSVGGGDNLTNHPDYDLIVENMSIAVRKSFASMSEDERKSKFGMPGKLNPNWKGGVSRKLCACGSEMAYYAKCCSECLSRAGSRNSFFGKSHTDEAKKKLSQANKGKKPPNSKRVQAEGICFLSLTDAATFFGKDVGTIIYRANSKKDKFSEYFYI